MDKKYTVYVHTFPDGKMYFGKTSQDVMKRWGCGHNYKRNLPMWQAIQEVGWDNIVHSILKSGLSEEEAAAMETFYIEEYNTTDPLFGYNRSKGDSHLGMNLSEEHRRKIGEAMKGKATWMNGKHLSEETRRKIGEAMKGNKHMLGKHFSEEHRRKIGEVMKGNKHMLGKHHSEETRRKIGEAMKGNKHMLGKHFSEETRNKLSEFWKGKPKPKYKWLTPDGSVVEMTMSNAHKHHPDWKQIE